MCPIENSNQYAAAIGFPRVFLDVSNDKAQRRGTTHDRFGHYIPILNRYVVLLWAASDFARYTRNVYNNNNNIIIYLLGRRVLRPLYGVYYYHYYSIAYVGIPMIHYTRPRCIPAALCRACVCCNLCAHTPNGCTRARASRTYYIGRYVSETRKGKRNRKRDAVLHDDEGDFHEHARTRQVSHRKRSNQRCDVIVKTPMMHRRVKRAYPLYGYVRVCISQTRRIHIYI